MTVAPPPSEAALHRVVVLVLPGVVPFDLAVPAQVFGHRYERSRYRFSLCTEHPGLVESDMGFGIQVEHGLDAMTDADTVIVAGFFPHDAISDPVAAALRDAAARGARIASICAGAFALAHAGLLDGRAATTHWAKAEELARRFPQVEVRPDELFVDEGRIVTGAGVAAAIDLCLHLYRQDNGAVAADEMARGIVAPTHRVAGQRQHEPHLPAPTADALDDAVRWASTHLDAAVTVSAIAERAHVSRRTLDRWFDARFGVSPMRWLTEQRVLEAQRLLETTTLPIEQVGHRSGLGTGDALRHHFRARFGSTPIAYRRSHGPLVTMNAGSAAH